MLATFMLINKKNIVHTNHLLPWVCAFYFFLNFVFCNKKRI